MRMLWQKCRLQECRLCEGGCTQDGSARPMPLNCVVWGKRHTKVNRHQGAGGILQQNNPVATNEVPPPTPAGMKDRESWFANPLRYRFREIMPDFFLSFFESEAPSCSTLFLAPYPPTTPSPILNKFSASSVMVTLPAYLITINSPPPSTNRGLLNERVFPISLRYLQGFCVWGGGGVSAVG